MVDKKSKKSNGTTNDNKIGIVDFVQTLNDNQSKIGCIAIYHNSRDKFDNVWINRAYGLKAKFDKINDLSVNGCIVAINHNVVIDFAKFLKIANDCLITYDKKGKILKSLIVKDNQIVAFDIDKHNANVMQNQLAKKSTKSLLSDLSDDDLSKVKDFIATLKQ